MKAISSTEQLLRVLEKQAPKLSYGHFSAFFAFPLGLAARLHYEFRNHKRELEIQPLLQPSRKWLHRSESEKTLLFAPHIPNELSKDLREAGIPHGDLNGRLFLLEDDQLVDIRPQKTQYKTAQKGADPFSLRSTRILRVFLSRRDQEFTQEELMERTNVSRSLISQVLGQLTDEGYLEQEGPGGRSGPAHYRLKEFDLLLDAWANRDNWNKRVSVHQYSVLANDPEVVADRLIESVGAENLAFTQWIAAWKRRPHTTPPLVSAYLKHAKLLDAVPGRPVNSGGNLWLILPKDEGIWLETQKVDSLPLVSDVQIYLDLLPVSQRGPEQAHELRGWKGFAR